MIQRRQFIGSLAAVAAVPALSKSLLAAPADTKLPWNCDVIRTIPHGRGNRAPVVTDVSIQNNGNFLAIAGDDHHVGIYDIEQSRFIHDLRAHADWIRTAKFSPDGKLLATAGNDRKLKIWDSETFKSPTQFRNKDAVINVAFSSDSSRLATVGFNSELKIYDVARRTVEKTLRCQCDDNHAVTFSQDNSLIAAGGRSGAIRVWETNTGRQRSELNPHRQRIRAIEFTRDNQLISCSDDQAVKITDLQTEQSRALPSHGSKLFSMAILENGLLATAGSDNQIHVWMISDSQEIGTLRVIQERFPVWISPVTNWHPEVSIHKSDFGRLNRAKILLVAKRESSKTSDKSSLTNTISLQVIINSISWRTESWVFLKNFRH